MSTLGRGEVVIRDSMTGSGLEEAMRRSKAHQMDVLLDAVSEKMNVFLRKVFSGGRRCTVFLLLVVAV